MIGFIIGVLLGAVVGMTVMAMLNAASLEDDKLERNL